MSVVQPVPYEPCHGRPDSQPARPRLPPGCGSRIQSSPSAGAPPPLRTPGLTHGSLWLKQCSIFRLELKNKVFCTHVCSRRWPSISHKGHTGRVC